MLMVKAHNAAMAHGSKVLTSSLTLESTTQPKELTNSTTCRIFTVEYE